METRLTAYEASQILISRVWSSKKGRQAVVSVVPQLVSAVDLEDEATLEAMFETLEEFGRFPRNEEATLLIVHNSEVGSSPEFTYLADGEFMGYPILWLTAQKRTGQLV